MGAANRPQASLLVRALCESRCRRSFRCRTGLRVPQHFRSGGSRLCARDFSVLPGHSWPPFDLPTASHVFHGIGLWIDRHDIDPASQPWFPELSTREGRDLVIRRCANHPPESRGAKLEPLRPTLQSLSYSRSWSRRCCTSCRCRCAPACSCRIHRRDRLHSPASLLWRAHPSSPRQKRPRWKR
ncbi:hypothetical protein SAMN05877809_106167 [Rhodobacter sp. JA431]|nr:hypothetical protein SAMN05877809_106167 [Rhodobacter sp. JA431]